MMEFPPSSSFDENDMPEFSLETMKSPEQQQLDDLLDTKRWTEAALEGILKRIKKGYGEVMRYELDPPMTWSASEKMEREKLATLAGQLEVARQAVEEQQVRLLIEESKKHDQPKSWLEKELQNMRSQRRQAKQELIIAVSAYEEQAPTDAEVKKWDREQREQYDKEHPRTEEQKFSDSLREFMGAPGDTVELSKHPSVAVEVNTVRGMGSLFDRIGELSELITRYEKAIERIGE